jgi:hypothetical protein
LIQLVPNASALCAPHVQSVERGLDDRSSSEAAERRAPSRCAAEAGNELDPDAPYLVAAFSFFLAFFSLTESLGLLFVFGFS